MSLFKLKKCQPIVGLDIGASNISVSVGVERDGQVEIVGNVTYPSTKRLSGVLVNPEERLHSIRRTIEKAELISGHDINEVYVGIGGKHIKGYNSRGLIILKNRTVNKKDIKKVIDAAKASVIPDINEEIIQVIPQSFKVDGQDGISDPLNLSGNRLEVRIHVVTTLIKSKKDILSVAKDAGLKVSGIVVNQLASGTAVLSVDEKNLGVVLLDIGGETTDIAIYKDGEIRFTATIPMGGNLITKDIAKVLKISLSHAEKLKKKYGCALRSMVDWDDIVEIHGVGKEKVRTIRRRLLCEIIEARTEELLIQVKDKILNSNFKYLLSAGTVITGGTSKMAGILEITEEIFKICVRKGTPIGIKGIVDLADDPICSTSVGLVLYGLRNDKDRTLPKNIDSFDAIDKWKDKVSGWFDDFLEPLTDEFLVRHSNIGE